MSLLKLRCDLNMPMIKLLNNLGKVEISVHLRRETLIGSIVKQELDDLIVILLGSHVQRSESILRLDINCGTVLDKYIDYFALASWRNNIRNYFWRDYNLMNDLFFFICRERELFTQRSYVQRGVSLLRRRVYLCASLQ